MQNTILRMKTLSNNTKKLLRLKCTVLGRWHLLPKSCKLLYAVWNWNRTKIQDYFPQQELYVHLTQFCDNYKKNIVPFPVMCLLSLFVFFVIMSAISNLKVKSWKIVTVVVHAVLEVHLCDCFSKWLIEKIFSAQLKVLLQALKHMNLKYKFKLFMCKNRPFSDIFLIKIFTRLNMNWNFVFISFYH